MKDTREEATNGLHSCILLLTVFFDVDVVLVACHVVYVPWWLHVMMLIRNV